MILIMSRGSCPGNLVSLLISALFIWISDGDGLKAKIKGVNAKFNVPMYRNTGAAAGN
jgi:hypothetical protein